MAIVGLMVVALLISLYILDQQRMRFPLIEEKPFELKAEFSTAQAVVAGQGQTIRVSGVRIGDIGGVELKDGRAVVKMLIDPEYKDFVHTDATALLRPKTGLKDMFIDLEPGTDEAPVAKQGWTIPVKATLPDVNPDEIFSTLDADTRDYLKLLISDAGRGLDGRAGDLRDLFKRFEPTHRDLARAELRGGDAAPEPAPADPLAQPAQRRARQQGRRPRRARRLLGQRAARSSRPRSANVAGAVRELPSALQETTEALGSVERFAELLGPTTEKLRPAARALRAGQRGREAVRPRGDAAAARTTSGRSCARRGRSCATSSRRPSSSSQAAPSLTRTVNRLNHFFNMLAYNPGGREGPEKGRSRQEGYLFWLAWVQHMATQLFSNSDAHGTLRPVTLGCAVQHGQAARGRGARARVPAHADPDPHRPAGVWRRLMQKSAPSLVRVLTMVVFALSCFGLLLFLWLSFGGPIPLKPQGYRVEVAFPEAATLAQEADVRVAGVSVGKVRKVDLESPATARWPRSSSSAGSRRCARTPARCCARRRCWARPTSS